VKTQRFQELINAGRKNLKPLQKTGNGTQRDSDKRTTALHEKLLSRRRGISGSSHNSASARSEW
jgi:hypothetical protein